MLMTAREEPKCVLIAADDPAIRAFTRNSLIAESRYLFDCKVEDIAAVVRSVKIDVVVVIGERTAALVESLRSALAGARIPSRRIAVVTNAADARAVALQALAD